MKPTLQVLFIAGLSMLSASVFADTYGDLVGRSFALSGNMNVLVTGNCTESDPGVVPAEIRKVLQGHPVNAVISFIGRDTFILKEPRNSAWGNWAADANGNIQLVFDPNATLKNTTGVLLDYKLFVNTYRASNQRFSNNNLTVTAAYNSKNKVLTIKEVDTFTWTLSANFDCTTYWTLSEKLTGKMR